MKYKLSPAFPLILALTLTVSALSAAPAWAQTLTFEEVWTRVQQTHEGIRAERQALERARKVREAARALKRPSVTINASYTHLGDPVQLNILDLEPMQSLSSAELGQLLSDLLSNLGISPGQVNEVFTTSFTEQEVFLSHLVAMWPIYTGGRTDAAQQIREAQILEAEQRVELKLQAVFNNTAKYYFGVVLAERAIETRKMAEKSLERHLEHARKLEEQGQIARVERLSAQVTRDRAAVETRKAEEGLEIARLALSSLLAVDEAVQPATPLFVNAELPAVEEFLDKTLETFPGLRILEARSEQANGLLDVEKGARLPAVFAFGDLTLYEDNSLAAEIAPDWAAGVGVSFDLVDRSGQKAKIQAARSAILQVQHLQTQARRDLRVLVEKTRLEAVQAREEFNGLESSLELAEENAKLREIAFAQGLSTSLEVVDSQLFITAIRTQRMAAAYNYVNALARLLSLSGQSDLMTHYKEAGVEVTP